MMPNWIAGYQKSGTTWMLWQLVHVLRGPHEDWVQHVSMIPNWDGTETPPLGWVRGHVDRKLAGSIDRALYIVRHPYDVALSAWRYRSQVIFTLKQPLSEYIDDFIRAAGDPEFNAENGGTWPEHIQGWAREGYRVRYEDARKAPAAVLRRLLVTLGLEATDKTITRAVEAASIPKMRAVDPIKFMGPAVVGRWRRHFTSAQIQRAQPVFGTVAASLGYDVEV